MDDKTLLELAAKAAGMVDYNAESGSMRWRPKGDDQKDAARWNARYAGKECGTVDDKGYRRIFLRFFVGKIFKIRAHRLAWLIVHGKLPDGEIDHINQDKLDNRIANLRDVTKGINQRNRTRNGSNTSGIAGVTWHKQRGKWCAQASVSGKHHHIGLFEDIACAETAVRKFRAERGFTENHGRIVRAAAAIAEQQHQGGV